jgi:cytochrome c
MRSFVLVLIFGVVPALRAGAEPPMRGETPRPSPLLVQATPQVERGGAAFSATCARCHGEQGQGGNDGPRLIGMPNGLKEYQTTPKLFEFIKTNMPENAPGSLEDGQYWDILAFILEGNKLLPPGITLGPDTADQVKLSP